MKIAIFHNALDNIGGAEYVDLLLAREINADIYTTNIDKDKISKMGFDDLLKKNKIHSIGKVPLNAPFRQEMIYLKFKRLNLPKRNLHYDFYIIAGDWAMVAGKNHHPNLWYVYSPIREIWDLYEHTLSNLKFFEKQLFNLWSKRHRKLNLQNLKHIDKIISTSKNVQERVKKYLKKNPKIIYPPIDTKKYYYNKNGDFWLSVNRLIHHKRIELQLKAFSKLPNEKLVIVGSYEQSRHFRKHANKIKKMAPKNVEILSWIDETKLIDLYANCKGFITTSLDEDFGVTPIEAMASGKPVIAPYEGGYKETIIDKKTGILIENINEHKIIEAVKEIGKNPGKYKDDCLKQSKNFDVEKFMDKFKKEFVNL